MGRLGGEARDREQDRMVAAATILAIILVWSAISGPLDRRGITSALFFTAAGLMVGTLAPGMLDISLESAVVERVAEIALALLLFSDAARLDLHSLRHELGWPSRLLLIGLPLTMLAGVGVGALVFPGVALASVFLLATMLASTDAALGQKVVADTSVPARVRQALDVESGLNDGLAVPFFIVALGVANAELETGLTWAVAGNMATQIGWGLTAGLAAGILGGLLLRAANRRTWISSEWRQIMPLGIALLAYTVALMLGGSGFIAAFVGGIAFGSVSGAPGSTVTLFTEETGGFLAAATWIGFGALALTVAVPFITWQVLLYAALSLTLVRMVPVAVAFAGRGVKRPTVAFVGWFGPRGLASLVFALLAFERGVPEGEVVLTTVVVTVALSVVLHGLTSVPLVAAYHRWYAAHTAGHPAAAEAASATLPRRRRQFPGAGPT
ncbi:sodium:proton antiporter [Arthrobacter sp. ov118]|uniref:cation:proton antiporter n=1 Tax=Arthrobacter sp. ov118 TaxID=1761747 RepID=UPI00116085B2|nr:cation:proton antiporter [Arthrobacter sp. ov118]